MDDNVIWVDFSKKQKTKRKLKFFLLNIVRRFKNIFLKLGKKGKSKKNNSAHKSINY